MGEGTPGPLRIGTNERNSAMKALDTHLEEGRLGVEEYGERSAKAANATLASELTELFTDLPAPHPAIGGTAPLPAVPTPTQRLPVIGPADAPVARRGSGFLDVAGPRLVAVMPFVALALFFTVGGWWWFLLIPASGALLYGSRHDDDHRPRDRRDRRRDR